uniref:APC down-regulated 1 like n=1 Tax=Naja naja TaxID=35670 RepID=A0A8C6VGZ3_NAJNA
YKSKVTLKISLLFNFILFHFISLTTSIQIDVGSEKVRWEPQCQFQLRHLQDGARISAVLPPQLEGHWISTGCEVRPGPEFLTRSYMFFANRLFKAYQFYYRDPSCREPTYSLVIKGKIRLRQASWITLCYLLLCNWQIIQRCSMLSEGIQRSVPQSVPIFLLAFFMCFQTARLAEAGISNGIKKPSVASDLSFKQKLIFATETGSHHDRITLTMQLKYCCHFLLQHHIHPCPACGMIYRADEHNPPVLPARPELPMLLSGHWVSSRCEVRPAVLFLTRYFIFHANNRSWEGYYHHYSDPLCKQPTFTVYALGHYNEGAPSRIVRGGTELVFKVTHARVTPMDQVTVSMLNSSDFGSCGEAGSWHMGQELDVTHTNGCAALGIKLPHAEYELFRLERDGKDRSLLFIGERPTDGSSPNTLSKRPTSYQSPLLQCGGPSGTLARYSMLHDPERLSAQANHGAPKTPLSLLVFLASLLANWD